MIVSRIRTRASIRPLPNVHHIGGVLPNLPTAVVRSILPELTLPEERMSKVARNGAAVAKKRDLIKEIQFSDWEHFKTKISDHLFPNQMFRRGKYLFRGHSDPSWNLIPTFDRMFANQSRSKRLLIADELLARFKRSLEGYPIPPEARASDSMLLALGQHYG